MHFERLTAIESHTVGEVLRAAADGPFFPDWEFSTLFGLSRDKVRKIADGWPVSIAPPVDVVLAVNNAANWLLSYPHRKQDQWSNWISVDPEAVDRLLTKLRGQTRENPFDRMM